MSITLAEQNQIATDGAFIVRIRQAGATVALEVMEENPTLLGGGNDEYLKRQALAMRFINDAPGASQKAAYILATAAPTTDPQAITDTQYLEFVRAKWSPLSGYNPLYVPDEVTP